MKTAKTLLLICLISLTFTFNLNAQKQGNIRYFGINAGIDFNSGTPVALTNGALNTLEGCASISDNSGSLLFYTDGQTVYNRLHAVMPNGTGLLGGGSSTQSALIVPKPGSANLYYLFTVPEVLGAAGFKYSIVDMSLASGNGDVINKNTSLVSNACEKLAATYHANGTDVWVTIHTNANNFFYTYLVSATGISAPVISGVGSTYNGSDYVGYLKFSPDGTKAAVALPGANKMEIFDFDKSTGTFSNALTFTAPGSYFSYGVEFSSTGHTLYLISDLSPADIYQFDMNAGSPAAIIASATIIHTINTSGGALQLGPDGKIYYNRYSSNWLGVINYPDSLGTACNPVDNGVSLSTGFSQIGLPNLISNLFSSSFTFTNTCFGDTTAFTLSNTFNFLGAQWVFGDPASGGNNVSFNSNPLHIFTAPGIYNVTAVVYYNNYTDTITVPVTISAQPVVSLGPDTSFCNGSSFLLDAGAGFSSYLWQDGSTNSTYIATIAGTYTVTVSNGSCSAKDSVVLIVNPCSVPAVSLSSSDTSFCEKKCLNFFDLSTNNPTSWQWSFPGSDSLTSTQQNPTGICYNNYGSFDVTLIACNNNGCDTLILTSFINEYQTPVPVITQSNDTLYSSPGVSYQWWNVNSGIITGATNNYYIPTTGGNYYCVVTDTIGCAGVSNTIAVSFAGINELTVVNGQLSVSPNPNDGSFIISLNDFNGKDVSLRIVNPIGQTVAYRQWFIVNSQSAIDVKMGDVAKGIYAVEVIDGDKIYSGRFMVR